MSALLAWMVCAACTYLLLIMAVEEECEKDGGIVGWMRKDNEELDPAVSDSLILAVTKTSLLVLCIIACPFVLMLLAARIIMKIHKS